MNTKTLQFEADGLKAGPRDGLKEGQFTAYASVFGNVDSYGDIVDPGAFTRTLGEWASKGENIPILWGHNMGDPFANIGGVLHAEEDDHGLKVRGELDLDNPTAMQVYRLLKSRRVNRMSFAYSVRDSKKFNDGNHLIDLDLFEVSIVPVPANPLAEVTAVKSHTTINTAPSAEEETNMHPTYGKPTLKEQRDALLKEAETIHSAAAADDRGLSRRERREVERISDALDELEPKIKASDATHARLSAIVNASEPDADPEVHVKAGSWGEDVAHRMKAVAGRYGVKALLSGAVAVESAVPIVDLPQKPRRLLDLFGRSSYDENSGSHYSYLRQVLRENNAAVVPDNAMKPTSKYTFEEVEDRFRVVAHLSEPFPLRYLEDYSGLAAILDGELKAGVEHALEYQLIHGDGEGENFTGILNTTGVLQQDYVGDAITTLRRARTKLEVAGVRPTAVAMHPNDVESLELTRENGNTGAFLLSDDAYERILGAGVVGVASPVVPEGTAILSDWESSVGLAIRQGVHTLAATQAGDLFDKNQVKLRTEGRFGLLVKRPASVVLVNLTA